MRHASIHPLDLLEDSEKPRNFRSPEEAIEHAVHRLAVARVLKDSRAESLARLELIDAYFSGKYFQQVRDHCAVLNASSNPRWRAEAALREARLLAPHSPDLAIDRLNIFAEFFGHNDNWCETALDISDHMQPSLDRDRLVQKISDATEDEANISRCLKLLAASADPEIKRRANEELFELKPTVDLALKISLALVESGNFKEALRVLQRVDQTDERIQKALRVVKLKI